MGLASPDMRIFLPSIIKGMVELRTRRDAERGGERAHRWNEPLLRSAATRRKGAPGDADGDVRRRAGRGVRDAGGGGRVFRGT